jgi:hypothetical protein
MLAVQGTFDGKTISPNEKIPYQGKRDVIIIFPDNSSREFTPKQPSQSDLAERTSIVESLFGILPSTIADDEIKAAREARYERTA